MKTSQMWTSWLSLPLCLSLSLASAQETAQPARVEAPATAQPAETRNPDEIEVVVEVRADEPNQGGEYQLKSFFFDADAQSEPGKYWIGVLCVDAGDALRDQLGLEAGVGLLVETVTDEAPAKKAGVRKNDVLLNVTIASDDPKSESKPLTEVTQLVEAVQKAETKPLRLIVIRRGQKQTIEVTPAERPQGHENGSKYKVQVFHNAEDHVRQLLKSHQKQAEAQGQKSGQIVLEKKLDEPGGATLGLRLAGPIYVHKPQPAKLPEGMSMEFHQVVGQPEHILVRKGDQNWDVTTEQLDKLPEDVRAIVMQQMAARHGNAAATSIQIQKSTGAGAGAGQIGTSKPMTVRGYSEVIPHAVPKVTGSKEVPDTHLPADLSISVTRTGAEPARITVKSKGQTHELTDAELDKLPAEVRKHVETFLSPRGAAGSTYSRSWVSKLPPPAVYSTPAFAEKLAKETQEAMRRQHEAVIKAGASDPARHLHERQDAILKQLQQLSEKVEKLQQTIEKSTPK